MPEIVDSTGFLYIDKGTTKQLTDGSICREEMQDKGMIEDLGRTEWDGPRSCFSEQTHHLKC